MFKYTKHIRLINVYLLADQSKDKDLTIELYNYIENTIKTRKQNKYKITIMRFQHRFRRNQNEQNKYPHWKSKIKDTLKTCS